MCCGHDVRIFCVHIFLNMLLQGPPCNRYVGTVKRRVKGTFPPPRSVVLSGILDDCTVLDRCIFGGRDGHNIHEFVTGFTPWVPQDKRRFFMIH